MTRKTLLRLLVGFAFFPLASVANATVIEVTVTTNGPVGLAPAFAAFHDGGYDIFDVGGTASAGLEQLAELGDATTIISEANTAGYSNAGSFAPGGPFAPGGGTGSMIFTVAPSETAFSIASMVLPSNDWFIGTGGAVNIVSLHGAIEGTTLSFPLMHVYDAGTESEDFAYAPGGPLVGITTTSNPAGGTSTSNAISVVSGSDPFSVFANIEPAAFDTSSIDFTGGRIATVSLMVIPEPASATLFGLGVITMLAIRRRRLSTR